MRVLADGVKRAPSLLAVRGMRACVARPRPPPAPRGLRAHSTDRAAHRSADARCTLLRIVQHMSKHYPVRFKRRRAANPQLTRESPASLRSQLALRAFQPRPPCPRITLGAFRRVRASAARIYHFAAL